MVGAPPTFHQLQVHSPADGFGCTQGLQPGLWAPPSPASGPAHLLSGSLVFLPSAPSQTAQLASLPDWASFSGPLQWALPPEEALA